MHTVFPASSHKTRVLCWLRLLFCSFMLLLLSSCESTEDKPSSEVYEGLEISEAGLDDLFVFENTVPSVYTVKRGDNLFSIAKK